MRGGQPDWAQSIQSRVLFSPHTRGSTPHPQSFRRGYRILPACAGVTLISVVGKAKILNSPRMRGGQPLFIDWPFDGVSIHPACAGVNPCGYTGVGPNGDSPRTRGGQPTFFMKKLTEAQFSPHARGSTHETDTVNSDGIILPACAGVNPIKK